MHTSSLLMSNAIVLAHKAPKTQDMTVNVSFAVVRCEDPLEQETAQVGDVLLAFLGKSTGNHGFYNQIQGIPVQVAHHPIVTSVTGWNSDDSNDITKIRLRLGFLKPSRTPRSSNGKVRRGRYGIQYHA